MTWRTKKCQAQHLTQSSCRFELQSEIVQHVSPDSRSSSFRNMKTCALAIHVSLNAYLAALRIANTASKTLAADFVHFFEIFGNNERSGFQDGQCPQEDEHNDLLHLAVKYQLLQHDTTNGYLVKPRCCIVTMLLY